MGKVEILAKKQNAYFLGINCGRLKSAKKPTQKLAAQFHLKQCSLQIRPPKKASQTFKNFRVRNKYYKKKSVGKHALAGVLQYQRLCPVRAFCSLKLFAYSGSHRHRSRRLSAPRKRAYLTLAIHFLKRPRKYKKMPQPEKHSKPRHIQ